LSRYLIPQSQGYKSRVIAPIAVSVINFQTARGLRPEGGPWVFAHGVVEGGYFVNHSTGFIIEDVRVNGGTMVRLRPQRRKRKEKPTAGATMENERESGGSVAEDDSAVREGYPALKSER